MNGNEAAPEVNGIDGVNATYTAVLKKCMLSGPTKAAEVIKKATAMAKVAGTRVTGPLSYNMLLLLTDGEIDVRAWLCSSHARMPALHVHACACGRVLCGRACCAARACTPAKGVR
jgi:hypothetical protein